MNEMPGAQCPADKNGRSSHTRSSKPPAAARGSFRASAGALAAPLSRPWAGWAVTGVVGCLLLIENLYGRELMAAWRATRLQDSAAQLFENIANSPDFMKRVAGNTEFGALCAKLFVGAFLGSLEVAVAPAGARPNDDAHGSRPLASDPKSFPPGENIARPTQRPDHAVHP